MPPGSAPVHLLSYPTDPPPPAHPPKHRHQRSVGVHTADKKPPKCATSVQQSDGRASLAHHPRTTLIGQSRRLKPFLPSGRIDIAQAAQIALNRRMGRLRGCPDGIHPPAIRHPVPARPLRPPNPTHPPTPPPQAILNPAQAAGILSGSRISAIFNYSGAAPARPRTAPVQTQQNRQKPSHPMKHPWNRSMFL